jgi:N-methylhydantoinase B/oxoprolinase/acetone carboxylase alpha subunit
MSKENCPITAEQSAIMELLRMKGFGFEDVQEFLVQLSPRRNEKVRRRAIALSAKKGDAYSKLEGENRALRNQIKVEVSESVRRAKMGYLETHP